MRPTSAVRTSFRSLFRSLDSELNLHISREVAGMEVNLEPAVFSYQRAASTAAGGAFTATPNRMGPNRLVRVERPTTTKGLFQE
mmetsp:Transcript_35930/g.83821  ORF Transcript_35930/g.83821 Transcript_35930/m.83821 type:complete len:84 (+) Transcript_35930:43-294(+)